MLRKQRAKTIYQNTFAKRMKNKTKQSKAKQNIFMLNLDLAPGKKIYRTLCNT